VNDAQSQLDLTEFEAGTVLSIGNFLIGIKIDDLRTAREFGALYLGYPREDPQAFTDFNLALRLRRPPSVCFASRLQIRIDGVAEFLHVTRDHGVPLLESAMNWCLGTRINRTMIVHSAVLERDGFGLLLPGMSGSGKSTLSACLVGQGWRLLSDEAALIDLKDHLVYPHPRPISLKNESIDIIAERYPDWQRSPLYKKTTKGTVTYLKAPTEAVDKARVPATPALILFPKFIAGETSRVARLDKVDAFMSLQKQSTNYRFLLERGFDVLTKVVEGCDHAILYFSNLNRALELIESAWADSLSRKARR
jgi:HprK-related kinase A